MAQSVSGRNVTLLKAGPSNDRTDASQNTNCFMLIISHLPPESSSKKLTIQLSFRESNLKSELHLVMMFNYQRKPSKPQKWACNETFMQ